MDNTFFILSDHSVIIERLHICTWDLQYYHAGIEIGIEFAPTPYSQNMEFKLSLPFMRKTDIVTCLMDALIRDDDNSKIIFNDTIKANKPIKGDKRNGTILEFGNRNSLSVLPIKDIKTDDGVLSFSVKGVSQQYFNYIRLHIQTDRPSLSVTRTGITKTSLIYDIKINERRNLPSHINELINSSFKICNTIKQCFCFHVVPSSYNISYVNSVNLKNIRILEAEAFNHYLPIRYKMHSNDYIIVFNKVKDVKDGTATFFSEFEKETIGNKQIILAIGTNIICSLLFGLSSIRNSNSSGTWYNKLPWEFLIAIAILLIFSVWLFVPWKKLWRKIRK